jgi:hypothetical protein
MPGNNATTFAPGATFIFNNIANQPSPTNISLNTATGIVTITRRGSYLVSFGFIQKANSVANLKYSLEVNGAIQSNQQITSSQGGGVNSPVCGLTTIVNLPLASNTLQLVNSSTTTVQPVSTDNSSTGVSAFWSIMQLQ